MPFLRFSRDKRGYEHIYLIQPVSGRRGKSRPRILYWFRTPPNVKVGREMFDDQIVRALEAQNPDVAFDWTTLRSTPIPPPESEPWRERRRAQRAARQLREVDEQETEAALSEELKSPYVVPGFSRTPAGPPKGGRHSDFFTGPEGAATEHPGPLEGSTPCAADVRAVETEPAVSDLALGRAPERAVGTASSVVSSPAAGDDTPSRRGRHRRRRGGRRDHRPGGSEDSGAAVAPAEHPPAERAPDASFSHSASRSEIADEPDGE